MKTPKNSKTKKIMLNLATALVAICGFLSLPLTAAPRIAILDFELKDLTLAPGIAAEKQRTAAIKPYLQQELLSAGYEITKIPLSAQHAANGGAGYLFDHDDAAAELGRQYAADYILVGRLHKPSFLFAYLMARLVRVNDAKLIGNFIVEAKGPDQEISKKAAESLTVKIDHSLENRYTPPPPKPH
jgi:hypothetical protein